MKSSLVRLISGNLVEAHDLEMIDCDRTAIESYIGVLNANWDITADQEKQFEHGMVETKNAFDRQFRPIQAFKGRVVPFCNVMRVGAFSKFWLDTLDPGLGDKDAGIAKDQI